MIEEIRRFLLVADTGNVTKSAEKLFVTQSALSQSLKRLEIQLKTKLFTHKGKSLHLTIDGIAVRELGRKILELWEKAQNPSLRQNIKQSYSLGMFDNAALRLGNYLQNNLRTKDFHLELTIGTSHTIFSQLQLGILDGGICVVDAKHPTTTNLMKVKTFSEALVPVSAKTFSGDIDKIPFILYNKGSHTRDQVDAVFTKAGMTPTIFAESTSVTFMKELALLGCGVALLPENFIKAELKQKTLKKQKLPLAWHREYALYLPTNGRLTKDHEIIQEIIKNLDYSL